MSGLIYEAALTYAGAGLSVVPVRLADKLPAAALLPKDAAGRRVWSPFQSGIPSADWLRRWFAEGEAGIALVCGRVSGGLEVLDFDHHPPARPQVCAGWVELVEAQAAGLVARLVIAATQHDGRHVFYRCPETAGNRKLAQHPAADPATGKPGRVTLIETRGEGGYVVAAPSPGYRLLQGSLTTLPTITPTERALLLDTARSFDAAAEARPAAAHGRAAAAELRPGDDYNARAGAGEIAGLLLRHGWAQVYQREEVTYWRRPGKSGGGWSATLDYIPGKLHVFSANAHPFDAGRAYDAFAVYTLLEQGGDWKAAARCLGRAGYGRAPARDVAHTQTPVREAGAAAGPAPKPAGAAPAVSSGRAVDPRLGATLPQIVVTNRPLPVVTGEALDALCVANAPPEMFVRSGALARVRCDERGRPVIDEADAGVLRARMARTAFWYRVNQHGDLRHVPPPDDVVKDLLALGAWPFPPLEALIEMPSLRPDGTILERPGYDAATGLYYLPPAGFAAPRIPEQPDRGAIQAAVALVEEAIGEFPFADPASRANAWALLLTPILRPAIRGNIPLALIDKPQAGTGASLLAELVALLATGRQAAMMTAPDNDEEWRKKITAALSEGSTVITIDNVEGVLVSAALAAALTSATWKDRILGQNRMIHLAQRATWLATGNNIRLGGDMPRRCYWIRLNARTAQPWRRRNFRHPGLIGWAAENRGQLLCALLTVARAWWADGCPTAPAQALGGFEGWAQTVGNVLAHAGITGFLSNLDELYQRVDEEGAQWQAFFGAWHETLGEAEITVAELVKRLKAVPQGEASADPGGKALLDALPDHLADGLTDPKRAGSLARQLGKALARRADMVFDESGLRLVKILPPDRKAVARWRVEQGRGYAVSAVYTDRGSG